MNFISEKYHLNLYKNAPKIGFALLLTVNLLFSGCSNNQSNAVENKNAAQEIPVANVVEKKEVDKSTSMIKVNVEQRDQTINDYLAGVAKATETSENKEVRIVKYGDLDNDGDEDAVAQFTLEGTGGGNNYEFRLAAFRNDDGQFTGVTDETVGGKMNRDVELTGIEKGEIKLDTKGYAKNDGACCPSIKGKTVYVLKNEKLTEKKK